MLEKTHKAQGALWVIVILAIVALLVLWISKKPTSTSTTVPQDQITASPTPTPTVYTSPTPTLSLDEIGNSLKDLNTSATEIDKGLNDNQLDVLN